MTQRCAHSRSQCSRTLIHKLRHGLCPEPASTSDGQLESPSRRMSAVPWLPVQTNTSSVLHNSDSFPLFSLPLEQQRAHILLRSYLYTGHHQRASETRPKSFLCVTNESPHDPLHADDLSIDPHAICSGSSTTPLQTF